MLFYEIKLAISLLLLIYQWYKLGFLDTYLHYLLERELSRLSCLPVEVESLKFQIVQGQCVAWIVGLQLKAPAVEIDNRWELEHIVTVDMIEIQFPFFSSTFLYLLSFTELAVVDKITVFGLRAYVEGYRGVAGELTFNVNLIGKRSSDGLEKGNYIEEIASNFGLDSADVIEDYFEASSGHLLSYSFWTGESKRHKSGEEISSKSNRRKSGVKDADEHSGFYHAAKVKLAHVYEKTKQTISEGISERIDALHVHLCGPEPVHFPGEFRFVCNHLYYEQIEIHMCRALPPQLRYLEQRPLVVSNLSLYNLGKSSTNTMADSISSYWETNDGTSSQRKSFGQQQLSSRRDSLDGNYGSTSDSYSNSTEFWNEFDIYNDGMDIRIFKYRFERKMLHALCTQNAGKICEEEKKK